MTLVTSEQRAHFREMGKKGGARRAQSLPDEYAIRVARSPQCGRPTRKGLPCRRPLVNGKCLTHDGMPPEERAALCRQIAPLGGRAPKVYSPEAKERKREGGRIGGKKGGRTRAKQFTSEYQAETARKLPLEVRQRAYRTLVERYGKHFASKIIARARRDKPSNLEKIVMSWLDEMSVTYKREWAIEVDEHLFFVDFLICNGHKGVVEVDGAYWHRGEDRQARDRQRDADLHVLGYEILRLPEAAILDGSGRNTLIHFLEELA